ncbi:hypothetical protein ACFE04_005191 [Oxalis oulophora]
MGRAPCCDKANVKKGPWSPEEDSKLKNYIEKCGTGGNWIALPQKAGLRRCGKSCRLRWLNYLRPNIKHGEFSDEEDRVICTLYANIGSRWSIIAAQLPGRTDNDIKNYWNTKLKKKLMSNSNIKPPSLISSSNNIFTNPSLMFPSESFYQSKPFPTGFDLSNISSSSLLYNPSHLFNNNNVSSLVNPLQTQMQYYCNNYKDKLASVFGTGDQQTSCSSSDVSYGGRDIHQVKQEDLLISYNNNVGNGVQENICYNGYFGEDNNLSYLEEVKKLISINDINEEEKMMQWNNNYYNNNN